MTRVEPSPPPASAPAGQASVDYAALLAVVAATFALAGAATGLLASVPARVVATVRTGLCIVGGDICRGADARAEGLAPCVVDERAKGAGITVSFAVLRIGEQGEWTAARRSDGTVLVTHSRDRRVGAGLGIGLGAGIAQVGADGSLDLTVDSGEAWELPTVDAAARLIAGVHGGRAEMPPTWRFGAAGGELAGQVGLRVLGSSLTVAEGESAAAAGIRVGRGERTTFIHTGAELTGIAGLSLGGTARGSADAPGGGRTGPVLFAVTRDARGLRELEFRHVQTAPATPGHDHDVVETTGRLDLRDPSNRAVVERLLRFRLPWPPEVVHDLQAVIARTAEAGTVERATYAVADRSHDYDVGAKLGVELGIGVSRLDLTRRLVAASAWTRGSPERRRVDCVGEAA